MRSVVTPGSGMMGRMESVAVEVVVTGHVQGVFYRAGLREQARQHEVRGWARNEADGSVRAWLEGSPEAVETVLEWCAVGSPGARVDDVRRRQVAPAGESGFGVG